MRSWFWVLVSLITACTYSCNAQLFYKDPHGAIQGPFPSAQMQQWWQAGYFPQDAPVSTSPTSGFIPISKYFAAEPEIPQFSTEHTVNDGIDSDTEPVVEGADEPPDTAHEDAMLAQLRGLQGDTSRRADHIAPTLDVPPSAPADSIREQPVLMSVKSMKQRSQITGWSSDDDELSWGETSSQRARRFGQAMLAMLVPRVFKPFRACAQILFDACPRGTAFWLILRTYDAVLSPTALSLLPTIVYSHTRDISYATSSSIGGAGASSSSPQSDELSDQTQTSASMGADTAEPVTLDEDVAEQHTDLDTISMNPLVNLRSASIRGAVISVLGLLKRASEALQREPLLLSTLYIAMLVWLTARTIVLPYIENYILSRSAEQMREAAIEWGAHEHSAGSPHLLRFAARTAGVPGAYTRECVCTAVSVWSLSVCGYIIQTLGCSTHSGLLRWLPLLPATLSCVQLYVSSPSASLTELAVKPERVRHIEALLSDIRTNKDVNRWGLRSKLTQLRLRILANANSGSSRLQRLLPVSVAQDTLLRVFCNTLVCAWAGTQLASLIPPPGAVAATPTSDCGGLFSHTFLRLFDAMAKAIHDVHGVPVEQLKRVASAASIFVTVFVWAQFSTALFATQRLAGAAQHSVTALAAVREEVSSGMEKSSTGGWMTEGPDPSGGVRLEHLTVVGNSGPILKDVTAYIPGGKIAVVVGPCGSGKSALLLSIIRELPSASNYGSIMIHGRPVEDWQLQSLRERVSLLKQQETELRLPLDLALRLQKASPATVDKDAQLQRVLQLTGVREIIEQLPQGITTDLSDPSVPQLTPGQWRRIAVARALYCMENSDVVLLDEPFAHLTEAEEGALLRGIRGMLQPRQVILASSTRASVGRHADIVIVLDRGMCTGVGNHAHLSASCATYARMLSQEAIVVVAPAEMPAKTSMAQVHYGGASSSQHPMDTRGHMRQ